MGRRRISGRFATSSWARILLVCHVVARTTLAFPSATAFRLPRTMPQHPGRRVKNQRFESSAPSSRWSLYRTRNEEPGDTPGWLPSMDCRFRSKAWLGATAAALGMLLGTTLGGLPVAVADEASSTPSAIPEYLSISDRDIAIQSNQKLVDYAVGTVNTQYYDSSGGARFNPADFYRQWKDVRSQLAAAEPPPDAGMALDTREGTVETLKYLVSTLRDPYSKYMTREELWYELRGTHDGFLGTGAYIEVPNAASSLSDAVSNNNNNRPTASTPAVRDRATEHENFRTNMARERLEHRTNGKASVSSSSGRQLLTNTRVANLPVVTAVAPNSPAERAGLVVGDRIVGVGDRDQFLGYGRDEIRRCLAQKWGYASDPKPKSSNPDGDEDAPQRYFGVADLTIAKPVYSSAVVVENNNNNNNNNGREGVDLQTTVSSEAVPNDGSGSREVVLGYRARKVKLPTIATSSSTLASSSSSSSSSSSQTRTSSLRGDAVVQYELLASSPGGGSSIFETALRSSSSSFSEPEIQKDVSADSGSGSFFSRNQNTKRESNTNDNNNKVGYIRLTRFSKSSTEGYLNAVQALEEEGAQSYVIDLRNNYGGVIQEAMLTASTLLGDPHAILCYLLNARGGFTPVDVESYVVDARYPGYLLSHEGKSTVLQQVMRERPNMFRTVRVAGGDAKSETGVDPNQLLRGGSASKRVVADWDPPSSYASIHEQVAKRGIHRISLANYETGTAYGSTVTPVAAKSSSNNNNDGAAYRQRMLQQRMLQKDVVLLINEGTASSAEFFAAALQDNGRSLAVIGTKSFGKGIIQHTFPMPDGGGLKLTIGEFLRPSLRHVTNVFDTKFYDKDSGEIVGGGGIRPDVYCDSKQGIPGNPRSDLCVGVALDVLEEQKSARALVATNPESSSPPPSSTDVSW